MNRYKNPYISAIALVVLVVLAIVVILSAAKKPDPSPAPAVPVVVEPEARAGKTVGICLPIADDAWTATGELLESQITALGYPVQLVYGDGTAQKQNGLLLELMEQGVACLVIAPVDSAAMTESANMALEKNIPILSYGSLLMNTEATTGYICYDYQGMGTRIGQYIAEKLKLSTAKSEGRVHTVELFMGAPEDYNATLFHASILSALTPYKNEGVLEFKSRRTSFEDSCILDWSDSNAEKECANRLKNSYPGAAPDVCICASDSIAAGVIRALEKAGVSSLVTGNGATETGKANIQAGKQLLSVSTDPAVPAKACAAMVDWALFGSATELTMGTTYNNVTDVPTALCGFTIED